MHTSSSRVVNVSRATALAAILVASPWLSSPAAAAPVVPDFSPGDFVAGAPIDNPYYPLVPGTVRRYEADVTDPETGEVTREANEVTVTFETRTVAGVVARVVRDRAFEDGVIVEDTFDYFAQDRAGNVWYLGEDTTAYEYDDEGNLVGTSTQGAWLAGRNGARPGFIMPADRRVGFNYYQEFAAQDEALDQALILATDESLTTPLGRFDDVLRTRETSEIDPDFLEHKLYAPGVGEVMIFENFDDEGRPLNQIPLVSVTVIPLPPGAWAALAATALLLLPRGASAAFKRGRAVCQTGRA